jgi:hypothetical protein
MVVDQRKDRPRRMGALGHGGAECGPRGSVLDEGVHLDNGQNARAVQVLLVHEVLGWVGGVSSLLFCGLRS